MERVLKLKLGCLKPSVLLVCLLGFAQSALSTTVVMPPDDQMIIEARAIVRGRVLAIEGGLDDKENRIYTYVTVKVQEVLKGQIERRKIVLKQPGGRYGNLGTFVFGTPEFTAGENVLLYLDTWRDGSLRVHQMLLGKFGVVEDPSSGKLFAIRNSPNTSVNVIGQSGNGPITNRMELSAYTQMVRSRLEINQVAAQDFDANVYRDVPILARPPAYTSSIEKGDLEPEYHLWNPPARWFEADTGQQVVFKTNPDNAPSAQVENDVAAATVAWSTVSGCALRVADGGTTTGCGLFTIDGENTVSFNNCDGYFSGSGTCSSGILAVTSIARIDYSQVKVVNGTSFYRALDSNLTFNPYASCYFSDHCNLQEIITHEMGHGLGLHHSWDSSFPGTPSASDQIATMYWVAHFDGRCASLRQDDINGITFIYPGTGGGPGPLSITTSALSNGTVGSAYNQSLVASGGTSPYAWSLVAGQGTLPTGLTLSAGGSITGTPTTAGTYNFSVKVTDALSATAQKALSIVVVAAGALPYDAQFVSQNVPVSLSPGQTFSVNMKFLNTGTQTWSGSGLFWFASQNPALNQTWGGSGLPLDSFLPIPAGHQLDVTFPVTAPSTPGVYNFQWQMYKNDGTGFFGQASTNVVVNVGTQPVYEGYHDSANCQAITGWAWDKNQPNSAINVDIYDGATLIATVGANQFRQDLLNAGKGNGVHGFSFATPASLKNGQPHSIRVKFSGTSTDLGTTPRTITCGVSYQGYLDWADCQSIGGWAWDSNQPNTAINVDIYDGATLIATVGANQFRQDLLNAGKGNGVHGFSFATPSSLKDGQSHSIGVKFSGTSTDLGATPKTITCGGSYLGYQDWSDCQSIGGWAWDSNLPNSPINVDIYDGATLIATVTANLFRQDLLNAGIGNGSHAFSFATPSSLKDGQPHSIRVKFSGTSSDLGTTPKTITCGGSYLGYHDWADCQSIGGWAWNSNQPISPINVDIYDGATLIATVSANLFRQDLLNAGIGNGSHAFSFATPASLKNAQPHSIRVKFSGTSTDLGTTPKTITCVSQ